MAFKVLKEFGNSLKGHPAPLDCSMGDSGRRPSLGDAKHDWTDHHEFADKLAEAEKAHDNVEQKMQKKEDPMTVYRHPMV